MSKKHIKPQLSSRKPAKINVVAVPVAIPELPTGLKYTPLPDSGCASTQPAPATDTPEPPPTYSESPCQHGYVIPLLDGYTGYKVSCGGPPKCPLCVAEKEYAKKRFIDFLYFYKVRIQGRVSDSERETDINIYLKFSRWPSASNLFVAARELAAARFSGLEGAKWGGYRERLVKDLTNLGLPKEPVDWLKEPVASKDYYYAGIKVGRIEITRDFMCDNYGNQFER